MPDAIQHHNPDGLFKSPAFSQVVTTQGPGKTIYIGGQNAVNASGDIVGGGDIALQTDQAMRNLLTALAHCGATFADVVKVSVYLVHGQDVRRAYQAAQKHMANQGPPPVVTGLMVAALANPGFLVEVEAIAYLPA